MATVDLPPSIERQLLTLDRRVRDATFGRGISRFGLVVPLVLGACLMLDWCLALGTAARTVLLATCLVTVAVSAWRALIRPLWRRATLAELAALIERDHPELKERLTSLVELQEEASAGTSPVMADLLARQTARAVERLDLTQASPATVSAGRAALALLCCVALLGPFVLRPVEYSRLWARLLAPWGNFQWGSDQIVIVGGDRVVARGSDVPVQIELKPFAASADLAAEQVWLHWIDANQVTDSRRVEWDAAVQRFVVTLPHLDRAVTIHASSKAGQSERHRIDVADPPTITRLQMEIEPPPYTGLPARALDGATGEIRVPERSRIALRLEFNRPVATAELVWPAPLDPADRAAAQPVPTELVIPLDLAANRITGRVEALAVNSGSFSLRLTSAEGLANTDPARSLVVDPDLPPAISLDGSDDPVAIRPTDRAVVTATIGDDFALTAVELHLETSEGATRVDPLPATAIRDRQLTHTFAIDAGDFALKPGQAVTYRIRAVDNRPVPGSQETWTRPRTLMIASELPQDEAIAEREREMNRQIDDLRKQLAETEDALKALHQRVEKEALKQQNSDKTDELKKLEQRQEELAERIRQFAAELAQRPVTRALADDVAQLADEELAKGQDKLEQAGRQEESRDQLQPLSEAIDQLAAVDKELQGLEQRLSELGRLEQDLAKLDQLARNTERLAEQLEQLERQAQATPDDQTLSERRDALRQAGEALGDELQSLLKKHPELIDAARRQQLERLNELAEAAENLAQPQQQLAEAFEREARDQPVSAERPQNGPAATESPPEPQVTEPAGDRQAGAAAVDDQQKLAQDAARQAQDLKDRLGPEAAETQAAEEFAQQAARAARQAEAGRLEDAALSGEMAQRDAERVAEQLQKGSDSAADPAAELAQRQQAVAARLQDLAESSAAAQGARERGQQALADATEALSKELEETARQLGSQPLESEQGANAARGAQEAAQAAGQSMRRAAEAAAGDDPQQAAEQASQAAERLQQAARQAQQAPENSPRNSAVPDDLAARAARAAQQLQTAQEQLDQALNPMNQDSAEPMQGSETSMEPATGADVGQNQPGEPGASESGSRSAPEQGQPGQGQPGQGQPGQGQPGQGQPGQGQPGQGQPGQGQPGQGQPGQGQPGQGQPGQGQPGQGQPGQGQPGQGQPGQGQPGQGQPGQGQPGQGQPGQGQPGQGQPGQGQPGQDQPGQDQPGQGEPGQGQPGQGQPGQGQPGQGQPGQGQPGQGQPGQGQPGQGQPGQGQPGQGQPGQGQPGQGQPGQGQPGQGQPGQGQPGQGQPGQGQPGQGQPGQGQPGQGQPGQGQPGQGQPGQGQPGQGQPGQGQLGQGQPGQGQLGQGQPGQGQPGQGQPGQGQPGQGQPGQGQPGQGRPGQGQPGQGQPSLAQSAGQFREAANAMRQVLNPDGQSENAQAGQSRPGIPGVAGQGGPGGANPLQAGGSAESDSDPINTQLKQKASRNWGQLPGQLKTEILQGASKKPRPEYARQIKSYFDAISKPPTPDSTAP